MWELLCFGPHDVELLSTAVRRLEPLGLRLLHAAHSHAHVEGEAQVHEDCSRFYVERVQGGEADSDEEAAAFRAAVLQVLMGTYNSDDATKFSVRAVDEESLEKLQDDHLKLAQGLVPGVQDVLTASPLVPRREKKVQIVSPVGGQPAQNGAAKFAGDGNFLKQIPQRPAGEASDALAQQRWLGSPGNSPPLGPSGAVGSLGVPTGRGRSRRPSRDIGLEETSGELARVEELEAKVAPLEPRPTLACAHPRTCTQT